MHHHSHHLSARLLGRNRRTPAASVALLAAALALASCGQPTSLVDAAGPAQPPATTAAPMDGHSDGGHSDDAMDGGHTDGGTMDGGHTDGPGFTEVPGGIMLDQPEHGHHGQDPCMVPVTPADYEAADQLIANTTAAMKKYHNLDAAMAAGYVQIAPPFAGEGAHYLNPAFMNDGQFVNPDRVESLVYRDETLEAAMYMMDNADQPGIDVAGCLTPWHLHDNLCIADGLQIVGLSDWGDCPAARRTARHPACCTSGSSPTRAGPSPASSPEHRRMGLRTATRRMVGPSGRSRDQTDGRHLWCHRRSVTSEEWGTKRATRSATITAWAPREAQRWSPHQRRWPPWPATPQQPDPAAAPLSLQAKRWGR